MSNPEQPVALGELEKLNRAIIELALDCIITMDAEGMVREWNPAAERTFGYTRAEAVGQELAQLIVPPALRERHRRGLAHYLKTGEGPVLGRRIEIAGIRKDGAEILVELAINAVPRGEAPIFTAYLRDITGRRRDEDARRYLGAIVESSDDAIISKDLNGTITSWNRSAERLFGYPAAEAINQSIMLIIPPERADEEKRIIAQLRKGEPIEPFETVRRRKDGTYRNISLTVSPIKDETGRTIGGSKIARDITERVRSDRRRETQYAVASLLAGSLSIAEAAPRIVQAVAQSGEWIFGALWLSDEAGELHCEAIWRIEDANLAAFAETSRTLVFQGSGSLPGRVAVSKKPAWIDDVRRDSAFPRATIAAAAGLVGAFAFPLCAEGAVKGVIELFSRQLVEADADLLLMVESLGSQIGHFIQRRQTEIELQRQKEAAEAASAAKDRFLATLSHELRTPLTPVLMWAGGMANDASLAPDVRQGLQMISRNVELEARLIDDLLDLTRISRGQMQLRLQNVDVHDLLQHAIDIVRTGNHNCDVTLALHLAATHSDVRVDPARIQQVFWNVLRNAYKFTPTGGRVVVHSENREPGAISFTIADNGVGIAPEHHQKIFDAFEQVGQRREGLGLGLAISKAILESHSGTIAVRSEGVGKGTTFSISLPTIAAEPGREKSAR